LRAGEWDRAARKFLYLTMGDSVKIFDLAKKPLDQFNPDLSTQKIFDIKNYRTRPGEREVI